MEKTICPYCGIGELFIYKTEALSKNYVIFLKCLLCGFTTKRSYLKEHFVHAMKNFK